MRFQIPRQDKPKTAHRQCRVCGRWAGVQTTHWRHP
ncbi:hypothetical protein G7048_27400 (plasmid) [Diaphorobacter sp. HDW4B]|nr:hypothetical protein G7048_27400 [Diaphorobacter sp. HDW4B]